MGKEGNYSGGTKVYESKKEKKRRLVANNDVEFEELVITPVQIMDGATNNVPRIVLERKLCGEGNKDFFFEARSDGKRGGIGIEDQVNDEEVKSVSADSSVNQTDVTGASSGSSMPPKFSYMITAGAKENVSEPKCDVKRSMEVCDVTFSRKKPKADHIDYHHIEKSGVDKTSTFMEHTNDGIDSNMNDVQVSKLPVSCAKGMNGEVLSEVKLQQTSSKSEPGQRNHQNVEDAKFPEIGIKDSEDGRRSHDIFVGAQGKISMRILESRKKVAVSGDSILPFEKQDSTRVLRSTVTNKLNMSKHQLKRQVGEKPVYNMKHRKSDRKISSEGPSKFSFSKKNRKVISPKEGSKNAKLLHNKLGLAVKNDKTRESDASRGAIKRELREQIKNILLDAGWKIEFRPRLNRNYEDSIYVSPHGGAGYWSIVKAYDVYVSEFHKRNSNTEEAITTFAVIPPELLLLLKRNIINKRRTKKEMEEVKRIKEMEDAKRKVGIGKRKKKAKEVMKMKFRRNKGTVDDVRETIAMKRKLIVGNSKRRGCALLVRGSNKGEGSGKDDFTPYVWKRTILSWMIDLGLLTAYGKVKYMNMRRSRTLLDGRITRDGIQCSCCSKIFSVSKFEIHAGSKLHQPYENLCLEVSGISLLQCQINAWKKQESKQCILDTDGDDPNDDTCGICGDGGDLICCDSCPSTFHLGCLGIEMLPTGDWHCSNCSCKFCGTVHDSASQYGNASSSLFSCSQCAQKYHKDCVPEGDAVPNVSNSSSNLFCGRSCRKVFRKLQKFIGVRNKLDTGFYWSIVRRFDDPCTPLSTMAQKVESNSKIALAYAVMDECFVPIIDQRSGVNLIHNVVYNCGANFNRLNFSGFYTFILERGDEIIAAASVRIHDTRLAEMPFIGTRSMYRRQGMCRRLLKGIETALRTLCIDKLIIPAISELTETWTTVFGFKPLGFSQKEEVKSVNMLVFPDTGLLQKSLIKDSKKQRTNPELENKLETQISVKEDKNYSADEIIDSKKSKCDPETIQSGPSVSNQTTNFLLEASGCHAQFCRSVEGAANVQLDDRQYVCTCCNPVQNNASPRNYSKEMVAFTEESKNKVGDVMNAFSSQHPSSEFLHTSSRIEASESRSPQNESNFELSVADENAQGFLQNLRSPAESEPRSPQNESIYRKEDDNTLGFLQKLENKLHGNGVAQDVRLENCEPLDEGGGTAYEINMLKVRRDDNGLESNVNEENVEVSVDIISHTSTSPCEGTSAYSELCGNGCGANPKLSCVASNESYSQEKILVTSSSTEILS